jgi:hypothetical protein
MDTEGGEALSLLRFVGDALIAELPRPPATGGVVDAPSAAPVDLLLRSEGRLHGIEVRVLTGRQPGTFTVPPRVVAEAKRWASRERAVLHTVVADERQLVAYSGVPFYYTRGLPARLDIVAMVPVRNRAQLLQLVQATAQDLARMRREAR